VSRPTGEAEDFTADRSRPQFQIYLFIVDVHCTHKLQVKRNKIRKQITTNNILVYQSVNGSISMTAGERRHQIKQKYTPLTVTISLANIQTFHLLLNSSTSYDRA